MLVVERSANAWSNNVDNRLGVPDVKRLCENCVARSATVKRGTGNVELWSRSSKDAAAHASATLETGVRGVDNGVHGQGGDIPLRQHNTTGVG